MAGDGGAADVPEVELSNGQYVYAAMGVGDDVTGNGNTYWTDGPPRPEQQRCAPVTFPALLRCPQPKPTRTFVSAPLAAAGSIAASQRAFATQRSTATGHNFSPRFTQGGQ